jgi:hypothetical protein
MRAGTADGAGDGTVDSAVDGAVDGADDGIDEGAVDRMPPSNEKPHDASKLHPLYQSARVHASDLILVYR